MKMERKVSFRTRLPMAALALALALAVALPAMAFNAHGWARPRANGGTVVAWGANIGGETSVPTGLTDVVAIAAGDYHTVALKADGTVVAWGSNGLGQTSVPTGLRLGTSWLSPQVNTTRWRSRPTVPSSPGGTTASVDGAPAGLTDVVAIAAGGRHTVALKADGTVVAWGYDTFGQTDVPGGLTRVVAIAAGEYHSVAKSRRHRRRLGRRRCRPDRRSTRPLGDDHRSRCGHLRGRIPLGGAQSRRRRRRLGERHFVRPNQPTCRTSFPSPRVDTTPWRSRPTAPSSLGEMGTSARRTFRPPT